MQLCDKHCGVEKYVRLAFVTRNFQSSKKKKANYEGCGLVNK